MKIPSIKHIVKVTQFNEAEAKAAQKTLRWLEAGAPHGIKGVDFNIKFNMAQYISPPYNEGCGTACCIAGAMKQFMDGHETHFRPGPAIKGDFRTWDRPDLDLLFFAGDNVSPKARYWPNTARIKAPLAAKVLRHYLTTGEVDWTE